MTPERMLALYTEGQRHFEGLEMEADLSGHCLADANFSHSLIVVDFTKARLARASFQNANLKTCNFTEADLTLCDFRGASLCATTFAGALMEGADFTGAYFHSHTLQSGEFPHW